MATLEQIVDDEFVQPLRGAVVQEDMIATRQLIDSIRIESTKTADIEEVKVFAMAYILELRDGEQYKSPPTIDDIRTWIEAKGLDGVLDPYAVLATIQTEGTTWDRAGGSVLLKQIISPDNLKRIADIAVSESITEIKKIKWLSP
jgi:hypothetical protein